jgi:riboflavin synthase
MARPGFVVDRGCKLITGSEKSGKNLNVFTGIVEETGIVERIKPSAKAIELTVRAKICGRGLKTGDSIAVNGCCLTVVKIAPRAAGKSLRFDLLKETWKRTDLQFARTGSLVNLERALAIGDRLGGHFVTGHIDGMGKIVRWERAAQDHVLEIAAPADVMRYVVFKGSITVDGISLTVAAVRKKSFRVWIIPHTYKVTALQERNLGDPVNLEADLLGKYVRQFVT